MRIMLVCSPFLIPGFLYKILYLGPCQKRWFLWGQEPIFQSYSVVNKGLSSHITMSHLIGPQIAVKADNHRHKDNFCLLICSNWLLRQLLEVFLIELGFGMYRFYLIGSILFLDDSPHFGTFLKRQNMIMIKKSWKNNYRNTF